MTGRIIVHSLDHARAAFAAARALQRPLTIVSASGAGAYAGPAWFKALVEQATAECPDVAVTAVLDCGAEPGVVLNALRLGLRCLRFTGNEAARQRLVGIAAQLDAEIEDEEPAAALDLRDERDAEAACRHFLASGTAEPAVPLD